MIKRRVYYKGEHVDTFTADVTPSIGDVYKLKGVIGGSKMSRHRITFVSAETIVLSDALGTETDSDNFLFPFGFGEVDE